MMEQKKIFSAWPIAIPQNYITQLNEPTTANEIEKFEKSEAKSIPYGDETWVDRLVKKYDIEQVLRSVGRPGKGG